MGYTPIHSPHQDDRNRDLFNRFNNPDNSGNANDHNNRDHDDRDRALAEARRKSSWILQLGLFLMTFACTTMAGALWAGHDPLEIQNWSYGLQYAVLILIFLSAHEFGHYFAARYHNVETTLPYFIPIPPLFGVPFGTMGAVIRSRMPFARRKVLFDIGAAGPLAGFVVCVVFLAVGFATLPPQEFIYSIHPEYRLFGGDVPVFGMYFGDSILYHLLARLFANPLGWMPPMNEMYHYPFLCVGWFGLFTTALNMLPIGQLDGGHITYAMFGNAQATIGRWAWRGMMLLGFGSLLGWMHEALVFDSPDGFYTLVQSVLKPVLGALQRLAPWYFSSYGGYLFLGLLVRLMMRPEHPPTDDDEPLGVGRMALGWLTILILVVSFSYNAFYSIERTDKNAIPAKRRGNSVTSHNQSTLTPTHTLKSTLSSALTSTTTTPEAAPNLPSRPHN
jgi:membrane-associated protease RseP (regulator of RpoE activity)